MPYIPVCCNVKRLSMAFGVLLYTLPAVSGLHWSAGKQYMCHRQCVRLNRVRATSPWQLVWFGRSTRTRQGRTSGALQVLR